MNGPIAVVAANKAECRELCDVLKRHHYRAIAMHSLANLGKNIHKAACRVIILDLDTLPVDNRFITDLRRENPGIPIMVLSSRPFHPELKEAMSANISACLGKPPDPEEIIYCLKGICENEPNS